jgi:hypothetical protein
MRVTVGSLTSRGEKVINEWVVYGPSRNTEEKREEHNFVKESQQKQYNKIKR